MHHNIQLTLIQGCCKLFWIVILFLCGGRGKKKAKLWPKSKHEGCSHAAWAHQAHAMENAVQSPFPERSQKPPRWCDDVSVPAGTGWAGTKGPASIFWSVPHGVLPFARETTLHHKRGHVHTQVLTFIKLRPTAKYLSGTKDTHFGSLMRSFLMKSLARALVLLKYSSSNS